MQKQELYLTTEYHQDIRRLEELANKISQDNISDDEDYNPDILNEG